MNFDWTWGDNRTNIKWSGLELVSRLVVKTLSMMPNTSKTPFQSNSVWLFRNIHTNQVIFSPHRVIKVIIVSLNANRKSKSALNQFPVPKRRTFPFPLRRDLWVPLVHAVFPNHLTANHIYKRLLDYRAWRLTSPPSVNELHLTKKRRDQLALNQVPTAIADLAHVTKGVEGKMIMNWGRFEERDWAKEWSGNIWHCPQGFMLKKGFRLEEYKFPQITDEVRKELGWDGNGEPPRDMKEAREQHRTIWEKMHPKLRRRRNKSETADASKHS